MPPHTRGSAISGSSTPTTRSQRLRPPYAPIHSILKEVDPDDEVTEHEAINAEIWTLDGKECVDILESNLRGPFQVVGTLHADQDQSQFLPRGAENKSLDFESSITRYAIDADPDAEVWVGTVCGWIKLRPSPQYLAIYRNMIEAITIMYTCFDVEDDLKDAKRILKVDDLPFQYARRNGTGLTKESVVKLFKRHAKLIIAHIHVLPDLKKSKLCMWLKQELPDIYFSVAEQSRARVNRQKAQTIPQVLAIRQPPPPREASPTPELETPLEIIASLPSYLHVSAAATGMGSATENEIPRLHPVQMMLELISSHDPTRSNLTAQGLSTAMYQDWSLWYPRLASAIVRLHAPAVLEQLPKAWKNTRLAETLHDTVKLLTPLKRAKELAAGKKREQRPPRSTVTCNAKAITDDEWLMEGAEYQTILRRNKKSKPKPTASSSLGAGGAPIPKEDIAEDGPTEAEQQALSMAETKAAHEAFMESITSRSRTPTPDTIYVAKPPFKTPHSQKSLPPVMEAKPSGKITKLKPKTVKRRRNELDDSSHSKRPRRLGSATSDSDIDMPSPSASAANERPSTSTSESSTESSTEAEELNSSNSNTPTFLPKELNMARGPMGSFRCTSPSCFFLEHEPDSKEGRARMLGHFVDHEKEDPAVVLARREAELNRRPVSYLMEKLRERGEQIDAKGKVIPLPVIKNGT